MLGINKLSSSLIPCQHNVLFQACSATEMTPASVTPAGRVLSATPTPSVACSTVTVHLDMSAAPATSTETSAALVREKERDFQHT